MYSKREIVDIDLGNPPNEVKGHEQAKLRPCLIIKPLNALKLLIVLPITSNKPQYALHTIVKLGAGEAGLTKESWVLCHQIRTVSINRVKSKRGLVSGRSYNKTLMVLKDLLEV